MKPKVLYTETHRHVDEEHNTDPSGVKVSLSFFDSDDNYDAPRHYLIRKQMMIDREMHTDETAAMPYTGYQSHARAIRHAIQVFDAMCKWLEEVAPLAKESTND